MPRKQLPPLNGLSIDSITVSQDGEIRVIFDLPTPQTTTCYQQELQGVRALDVYEHPELQRLCRDLFRALRKHVENPDPERETISCDDCLSSSCCRKYNVLVTEGDIERLAEGLGISRAKVVKSYLVSAVDWCEDYHYQLDCDEDDDGEKCVFLKRNDEGQMRCSIYEIRPEICRAFDENTCDDFVPMEDVGIME